MTLIRLATLNRERPSSLLGIDDPYTAYCLDETCLYMVQQARDGHEPDFDRPARLAREKRRDGETTNAGALAMLERIGIKLDNGNRTD